MVEYSSQALDVVDSVRIELRRQLQRRTEFGGENDLFSIENWVVVFCYVCVLFVQPVLCIVGVLLNSACAGVFLTVWNNRDYYRQTSLLRYLLAMSLCNNVQLLLSFPVIVFPAIEQFMDYAVYPAEYRAISRLNGRTVRFVYPLLMAANYVSIWILTLICAQRYQSICGPSNPWKRWLGFVRRSKYCVAMCIILALFLNLSRWFEYDIDDEGHLKETELRSSHAYRVFNEAIIYGLLVYLIPFTTLLFLNYGSLKLLSKESNLLTPHDESFVARERRTAWMTGTVSALFFLCTTMALCLRLIIVLFGNLFISTEYAWLVDASNLLMNTNALIMPITCFLSTRCFRDIFFALR